MFFAGSADGSIHQMNLFRQREDSAGGQVTEAVGGAGVSDVIHVGDENPKIKRKRLISVG
jgi:pre-rRNA-processing protein IPI3